MLVSLLIVGRLAASPVAVRRVRHAKITIQQCGTKQKSSYDMLIEEEPPRSPADGREFTRLSLETKEAGKTTATIRKGPHGWPIGFKMEGAGTDADPITTLLFMMRQPLWSPNEGVKHWTAKLADPFHQGHDLAVTCQVSAPDRSNKTIRVREKTGLISLLPGMKAEFESEAVCDSIGGRVKSLTIHVGVNATSKSGQLMLFEEKD